MLTKYVRRDIRREGLKNLKRRYYLNILIVFVVSVILNGGYRLSTKRFEMPIDSTLSTAKSVVENNGNIENLEDLEKLENLEEIGDLEKIENLGNTNISSTMGLDSDLSNSQIILKFILNVFDVKDPPNPESVSTTSAKYYGGVASVFVNEITGSQSFVFGIINGINEVVFNGRVASSVIIFVFAVISVFIFVFVKNVIIVGKNRYFLEQRRYHETGPGELLFPYKNKRLKNISKIMLIRYLFQLLWDLTIVGGIIKRYEYLLIPYIVAENPEIDLKDAFKISKQLMMGNKYRAFLIDFSFLPWFLLSYLTFNLSALFFSDAYIECVRAEVYMRIRNERKNELELSLRKWLNDDMLAIDHIEETQHPSGVEVLDIPTVDIHSFKHDYMRKYSFLSLVQLFFTYSLVGWIWEVALYLATTGQFVNRGTMHGPWLPIYGCGGMLIIILLRPFREKPGQLFVGTVLVCGGVEYFTSWILEKLFDAKWWDYTGYFLNVNGRICFEGLLVFGMAGLAFSYILSPMLDDMYNKVNEKYRRIICIILMILFVADFIWSMLSPNIGDGITSGLI
ncbi:Protein of unknown function [Lachnospiraceae bacterium]|nr:Protein of unknown function [Lachnospiraceae bacterium]